VTRHLGLQVSAYVDRRLDATALRAFDQHLVVCLVCRHAADEERRLLASLRSGPTPGFSADLHSMLLALAVPSPGVAPGSPGSPSQPGVGPIPIALSPGPVAPSFLPRRATATPPIPSAPASVRQLRVPTVAPAAPPLHRSPRRAAVVAGLAAGASAAAAIGLAVVGPGASVASATVRAPETRVPGVSAVSAVPALFSGSGLGSSPLRQALGRSGR